MIDTTTHVSTGSISLSGERAEPKDFSSHLFRAPARADGYAIWQLVSQCPPLDVNSVYSYLLLCEHFHQTCIVAERDAGIDGFISAYLPPAKEDVLFIWQVAVHERARGQGLGRRMLQQLLARPGLGHISSMETTVGPDNAASRGMFAAVARQFGATINESPLFEPTLFGPTAHEDERLLKIGPLRRMPG